MIAEEECDVQKTAGLAFAPIDTKSGFVLYFDCCLPRWRNW